MDSVVAPFVEDLGVAKVGLELGYLSLHLGLFVHCLIVFRILGKVAV